MPIFSTERGAIFITIFIFETLQIDKKKT